MTIDPKPPARTRDAFDQAAEEELEALALEGLNSGEPLEASPEFWEEMHRRLDRRLKNPD